MATIQSYYSKFLSDQEYISWQEHYRETSEQASNFFSMSEEEKQEFYRLMWREKSNGVASIGQGTIGEETFQKILPYIPEMTANILKNPNEETFLESLHKLEELKNENLIPNIARAALNRAFALAKPSELCTIANERSLTGLARKLNKFYGANFDLKSNWYVLNKKVVKFIKQNLGVESIDKYKLSTFCWYLFEALSSKKDEKSMQGVNRQHISQVSIPLNQILYGPPGTGKTFNTINHAVEICDPGFDISDRAATKERYDALVEAGQIVFTTFHQSMSYEDFVEGIKPETTSDNDVVYNVEPGLFHRIAEKAETNWENSKSEISAGFDSVWVDFISPLDEGEVQEIIVKTTRGEFKIYEVSDRTIRFEKQNGSRLHTLSVKTLKKFFSDPVALESMGGLQTYYRGLLDALKSEKKPVSKEELKKYVLIIDEINRGNVSAIFGELITLLEDDKRLGGENELKVKLPYSKEEFGVPANLSIIGTMNTADRSVEALDTALRRRFSFKEMMPEPELLGTIAGVDLKVLLETINERLEVLIGRDHTIGHAFFISVKNLADIRRVFRDKVIPQLQEYFYGDWEKIQLVLGDHFITARKSNRNIFAVKNYDDVEERRLWSITDSEKWIIDSFVSIYSSPVKQQQDDIEE